MEHDHMIGDRISTSHQVVAISTLWNREAGGGDWNTDYAVSCFPIQLIMWRRKPLIRHFDYRITDSFVEGYRVENPQGCCNGLMRSLLLAPLSLAAILSLTSGTV